MAGQQNPYNTVAAMEPEVLHYGSAISAWPCSSQRKRKGKPTPVLLKCNCGVVRHVWLEDLLVKHTQYAAC
eukprot:6045450-Amphidinium_carterae.2